MLTIAPIYDFQARPCQTKHPFRHEENVLIVIATETAAGCETGVGLHLVATTIIQA